MVGGGNQFALVLEGFAQHAVHCLGEPLFVLLVVVAPQGFSLGFGSVVEPRFRIDGEIRFLALLSAVNTLFTVISLGCHRLRL